MADGNRGDDQIYVVILGLLCGITVIGLLGPIGMLVALVTIVAGALVGVGHTGAAVIGLVGAGLGMVMVDPLGWLLVPMRDMAEVYRAYLFGDSHFDADGLRAYYATLLLHGPAWAHFTPLGVFVGGFVLAAWQLYWASPLRRTARGKPAKIVRPGLRARFQAWRMNRLPAAVEGGSFLGIDRISGDAVTLSDEDANTHSLVLGTPGSGKTVAILNLVESAIQHQLPLIYVDGKGDYQLGKKVIAHARASGRPAYLFAMRGESCLYNPLAAGGFSAKKDRIIELRDWSEDHYRKLGEGYLQTVFKVLEACDVNVDLVKLAELMSVQALSALVKEHTEILGKRTKPLAFEIGAQKAAEAHVESVHAEIRNLAWSEIGFLFDVGIADGIDASRSLDCGVSSILELPKAIEERAIVYFCLPTLQFPALARSLGKLVINDLKASAQEQSEKPGAARAPIYAVFDEFSVFAGDQVLNVINMGRSAGIHAVLATQSVADLGRATPDTPDHFTRQVISSCNNYLVHRLNAPEDATLVAELIGTEDGIEHTVQIDGLGMTGMGSVRRTRNFLIHPDRIKQLPRGHAIFLNKSSGEVREIRVRLGKIAG